MRMKGQSAIEFLTTYAWVFIMISIFVAVVSSIALSNSPTTFIPSSCFLQPELPCPTAALFSNSVTGNALYEVVIINKLGSELLFLNNALNVTPITAGSKPSYGQCYPANAPSGATIVCNATINNYNPSAGSQLSQIFTLSYLICSSSCSGLSYNTTGYSSLTAQPYAPYVKLVTLLFHSGGTCLPPYGYIAVGGVRYSIYSINGQPQQSPVVPFLNNQKVQLQYVPINGYTFNSWSASNTNVVFSSTTTNPTNVMVPANIAGSLTITANCN